MSQWQASANRHLSQFEKISSATYSIFISGSYRFPLKPPEGTRPRAAAIAPPTGPATLKVAQNATLGSFLVDQNGMTLYIFTKDTAGVSTCSGGCPATWPALLTNGAPVLGDPSITGQLGVITRSDGSQQVTINDMPLYYYSKDMAAGDTNGQGVGSVWYVVQPSGTPKQ